MYKCTAGYDTIGYGKRIKYLQVTEEQATEWLKEDLKARFIECDAEGNEIKKEKPKAKAKPKATKKEGK